MVLEIEDIWTVIDRGYEKLAMTELAIVKREMISGDIKDFLDKRVYAIKLYSYIVALENMRLNIDVVGNQQVEQVYNKIMSLIQK